MRRIEAKITGRVQMVMFRDFACRKARGLGLAGTAQNLPDGSVRIVAEGDEKKLFEYFGKLREGSLLSRVDSVEAIWSDAFEDFSGFDIVY